MLVDLFIDVVIVLLLEVVGGCDDGIIEFCL